MLQIIKFRERNYRMFKKINEKLFKMIKNYEKIVKNYMKKIAEKLKCGKYLHEKNLKYKKLLKVKNV